MQFLFFVDANTLPLSFLYHEYVSKLMHDINNNNDPLIILKLFKKTLQHTLCTIHDHLPLGIFTYVALG